MAKVKATEQRRDLYPDKRDLYAFKSKIAGMECYVAYYFIQNKLTRAKYVTYTKRDNHDQYVYDYEGVVDLLKTKYGKANHSIMQWREGAYEDEYKTRVGSAVAKGYLTYETAWDTPSTHIMAKLYSFDYDVRISIEYKSLEHSKMIEEEATKGL